MLQSPTAVMSELCGSEWLYLNNKSPHILVLFLELIVALAIKWRLGTVPTGLQLPGHSLAYFKKGNLIHSASL